MSSTTEIRNQIIDQLLAINDDDYLLALSKMIDHSHIQTSEVLLTEEQKLMLSMSEADIDENRVVDQHLLHDRELQWLKGK